MDNTDLEQQCEDALFEVCDARERYPLRCANELAKCIKLATEINSSKVVLEEEKTFANDYITEPQREVFKECLSSKTIASTQHNKNLQNLLNRMDNLNMVVQQLDKDENKEMNTILRK